MEERHKYINFTLTKWTGMNESVLSSPVNVILSFLYASASGLRCQTEAARVSVPGVGSTLVWQESETDKPN